MIIPNRSISDIKHSQREAELHRHISNFLYAIGSDDPALVGVSVMRTKLSPDRGKCFVHILTPNGKEGFEKIRPQLVLYRDSMRASLAQVLDLRYTPQIRFIHDVQFEKEERINRIIEDLKERGKL